MLPLGEVYTLARKLAKSTYYQTLNAQAKEIKIKLFVNDSDLTDMQIFFLNYLNFYNIINVDIALGEIEPIIKEDRIYEDAWMFYKQKRRTKTQIEQTKQATNPDITEGNVKRNTTKFVFRRK
jgi:hypothetical protein